MKPDELIDLLRSMSAAADVVEAIDYPVLQRFNGWNLRNWRYDLVPWGVRFRFREGGEKATITAIAVAVPDPACASLAKLYVNDSGSTTLLMLE
jgi:hypothetical protein